jgi:hypothetical protein
MTELVNAKTWTRTRVTGSGVDVITTNKLLLVAIKNEFKNHGWTVVYSSDSVAADAYDNWVDNTDIVVAVAGSVHSWIVLQNNNVNVGFQICIDMSVTDAYARKAYFYMSPSVGFTSGTIQNRPTASDETKLKILTDYWIAAVTIGTSKSANVFTSSDHQCTHVFLYSGSAVAGVWIFDVPKDCSTWVDNKIITLVNSGTCVSTLHDTDAEAYTTTRINGITTYVELATIVIGTTQVISYAGVAGATGDYGTNWPCTPMWLLSTSTLNPGLVGVVYDLWWAHSTTVTTGDYFPGDGSKTQYVFGNMVQGNDGGTVTL